MTTSQTISELAKLRSILEPLQCASEEVEQETIAELCGNPQFIEALEEAVNLLTLSTILQTADFAVMLERSRN